MTSNTIFAEEPGCGYIKTLNRMGFMTTKLDSYSLDFIKSSSKSDHILEIGAAFGIVTSQLIKKEISVVCNDLSEEHLQILWEKTPENLKKNLFLQPGDFLSLQFAKETFDAVFSARVFHFIPGNLIQKGLAKIYEWLKPGGTLTLINETPYLGDYKDFIPLFESRKKEGHNWPGTIENTYLYAPKRKDNIPHFFNLLDPDTLTRAFKSAGFIVQKAEYLDRQDYPEDLRYDGRESVAIIGQKPL